MFYSHNYSDIDHLLGCFKLCLWPAVFNGKAWEKEPLGRPRRRREDNIKTDLQEVGCEDLDWIDVAQDRDR